MEDNFNFPFQLLNDEDLINNALGHYEFGVGEGISLSDLEGLRFCPLNREEDDYMGDVNPDSNLESSLGFSVSQCKYYFPSDREYIQSPQNSNEFSLVHLNICSIPRNFDDFLEQCISPLSWRFDAIGVCETKLTTDIDQLYNIPFYTKFCNNRSRHSGGLALYVLDKYDCNVRFDLMYQQETIESLFVEVGCNYLVGVVYRRPNTNPREFLNIFQDLLETLKSERKRCYIMGDINLDLLKWDSSTIVSDLVAICHSRLFVGAITKPTRVTLTSATLIDHIWSNDAMHNVRSGILYTEISDHFPIFACYSCDKKEKVNDGMTTIKRRDFNEENVSHFKTCLREVCWDLIYASNNPNICFRMFLLIFCACFNKCFPIETKVIKTRSLLKPYITPDIKALIAERNRIQRKYAKKPITYGDAYRHIRNKVTQMIRIAKNNYFKRQLEQYSNNLKKYWQVINDILKRKKTSDLSSSTFEVDGELITDSHTIAENFNRYFIGVGEALASQCPLPAADFRGYLANREMREFCFPVVTENMLLNVVGEMKNSAAGNDEIPMIIVKKVISDISAVLLYLCNLSFATGVFPDLLEVAKVLPYFKLGDKKLFSNYRPISVLPAFSKILEKLASDSLRQFCNECSIITNSQFGFMKSKSTEDAILTFVGDVLGAFDEGQYAVGCFLDLSKAFDTVDHQILIAKLDHYGVRKESNSWFMSYLKFRRQYVSYNNCSSSQSSIRYGVPQGSILGPLLFLIYINDVVNASNLLKCILFADDSNFYLTHSDLDLLLLRMNEELNNVYSWIIANKLTLNLAKTHYIIFHRKRLPSELHPLSIGGTNLERFPSTKFLGLTIQENLKWDSHIRGVARKIDKLNGVLHQTSYSLTQNALKQVYYALIYPNIIYCQTVWGAAGPAALKPLITAQKRTVRILAGASGRAHTNSLFLDLSILKFEEINSYCCAIYTYKSLKGIIDNKYFVDRTNEFHAIRNSDLLRLPTVATTQSQRFIAFHGVGIWNRLPPEIRNKTSLQSFKFSLRGHLLDTYADIAEST